MTQPEALPHSERDHGIPDGYADWYDAAVGERLRRVKAERTLQAQGALQAAPELAEFARAVYDTFARSLAAGYRTRDKEYAISLLGKALGLPTSVEVGDAAPEPQ